MRLVGQKVKLRKEHMLLMRMPERYWKADFKGIHDEDTSHVVKRYMEDIHENLDEGVGLMFWGNNGIGKTSAACVVAKAVRRTGASVLFTTAENLRTAVISKEVFSDFQSTEQRASTVDLLVLDDLGKEHVGSTGWNETYWENLFRLRGATKKSTLVTCNVDPDGLKKKYHASMLEVMKETIYPIMVSGENRRDETASRLEKKFALGR